MGQWRGFIYIPDPEDQEPDGWVAVVIWIVVLGALGWLAWEVWGMWPLLH